MNFQIGKDFYEIKSERTMQFHFLAKVKYYGYKNGMYVSGTTSDTELESYRLLLCKIISE